MAPPRGYRKGYVKTEEGTWVDPRTLRKPDPPKKRRRRKHIAPKATAKEINESLNVSSEEIFTAQAILKELKLDKPIKKPLSKKEQDARRPPNPADLVGALQDSVHKNTGKSRPAKTTKIPVLPIDKEADDRADSLVNKAISKAKTKKIKDDLGPTTQSVKDDREHAKVIISWRDTRGRARTTQYTMADLSVREGVDEEFNGAKKKTRLHLSLDGNVLEKM